MLLSLTLAAAACLPQTTPPPGEAPAVTLEALELQVDEQRKALAHDDLLARYKALQGKLEPAYAERAAQRIALLSQEKALLEKAGSLTILRGQPVEKTAAALAEQARTAEEELVLARFWRLQGQQSACEAALARARDKDPELKDETDRMIAALRAEPVPRGGYHRYRGLWLPLAERDRLRALDDAYESVHALALPGVELPFAPDPDTAIATRLRGVSDDGGAALLRAAADDVRAAVRSDYSSIRDWLPSYGRAGARRPLLDKIAELEPLRKGALELIGRYGKSEQDQVDRARRELEALYDDYVKLRQRDRRTWDGVSPQAAFELVTRIEAHERALAAIDRYLSTWAAPGLPPAAITAAADADVSNQHRLPGREQSGLEDVLWLAARQRAGLAVDVLTRTTDLLRRAGDLTPYEVWLASEMRDDAIDAVNQRLASSLDGEERAFAQRLNAYRRVLGLRPFEIEERCNVAARKHSQEMVDLGYFGHISPIERNRGPSDRVRLEGYNGGVGENCLAGHADGVGAFEGWYHSPGHHRNLISGGVHLGVGATSDHAMWTMVCGGDDGSWRALHRDLAPARRDELAELARQLALALRTPARTEKIQADNRAAVERATAALPDLLPEVARIAFAATTDARHPDRDAAPALLAFLTEAEVATEWRPLQVAAIAAAIEFLRDSRGTLSWREALALVERHVGDTFGYDASAAEAVRAQVVRKIRKEWEDVAQWRFRRASSEPPATVALPGRIGDGASRNAAQKALTKRQRLAMAKKFGGGSRTEQAVERGLAFLAKTQDEDGAWRARSWVLRSPRFGKGARPGNAEWEIAMTGLTLLAFVSAGNTPDQGEFADNVRRGTDFLLQHIVDYGRFETTSSHYMYSHAMATQALCEVYAYTADPYVRAGAQLAVDYLRFAQHEGTGGWRYEPNQPGDTSVTGWVLLALNSAFKAKLDVGGFRGALRFLDSVTGPGYYLVGYTGAGDQGGSERGMRLSSIGMVGRLFLGAPHDDPRVVLHAYRLLERLPRTDDVDFYAWYYSSLGLFQLGGDFWKKWNPALQEALLALQDDDNSSPYFGSWPPDRHYGGQGGQIFSTALGVLMLTNYYRYDRMPKTRIIPFTGDLQAAVAPYVAAMRDAADPQARQLATSKMLDALGSSCAPALFALVRDAKTPRELRHHVAGLLPQVCEPQHEAGLHELLTDKDGVVVEQAMRALEQVCSAQSVPLLCQQLSHGSRTVRVFAARALARLGDPAASSALGERLAIEPDQGCKNEMQQALRRIVYRSAIADLVTAALGRDKGGVLAVMNGLDVLDGALGDKLAALREAQPKLHERCITAIGQHREGAAVPILILLLECDDLDTRTEAVKLLRALSARNFGFDPAADTRARNAALERWQGWWREHLAEFTLRRKR